MRLAVFQLPGGRAVLVVLDNGHGMDEEVLEALVRLRDHREVYGGHQAPQGEPRGADAQRTMACLTRVNVAGFEHLTGNLAVHGVGALDSFTYLGDHVLVVTKTDRKVRLDVCCSENAIGIHSG